MSDSDIKKQSLFEEFPPVSTDEWEKVISQDLNGADYKQKLRWETNEGVAPLPFYRREDLDSIERSGPIKKNHPDKQANDWEIREPVFADSINSAHETAQKALDRGADALQFHLKIRRTEGMIGGDLQGLPIQNQQDFQDLLKGVALDKTPLHFDAGLASPALLAMLWNEGDRQEIPSDQLQSTFSYDPFIYVLQNGQYPTDEEKLKKDILQLGQFTSEFLPGVRPLGIDARAYHNSGSSIVQELGFGLAAAADYFALLTDSGLNPEDVAQSIHFSFSIGSNYFLEIAKFRAARLLWKNLLDAFGADPETNRAYLHGETSQWNKTLYDPYTNMLRTTTEGMSAAIAGCDSITVLPFDQHFRQPNEFSQRTARNQQIILSEESYLDKVADPAAGSYYIEKLTEDIGNKAWKLFQEVETEGGLMKAIEHGTVQSAISESQEKRDQAIASRGQTFVGTNEYSNPEDRMSDKIESGFKTVSLAETEGSYNFDDRNLPLNLADAFADGAQMGDAIPQLFELGKHFIRTINPYRGTQAFEELRLATERNKTTPKVLTLPLGNRKMRKARSSFASNFFGCVGYNIKDPIGFSDVDEAISAVKNESPDIAVICSSDDEYRELVPDICNEVSKLENPPMLVLAGYPKEDIETYKNAGIDEFIYSKCNVLETLKRFQTKLDIIEN